MHLFRCGISLFFIGLTLAMQDPSNDVSPAIAMYCGKNVQHRDLLTGEWITDSTGSQDCMTEQAEMLVYCKKMYPDRTITGVQKENNPVHVKSWCSLGHSGPTCKGHGHSVAPVLCLEGNANTPSLTVKQGCTLLSLHKPASCQDTSYWVAKAINKCNGLSLVLTRERSTMNPCEGVDSYHGMEFVCCPATSPRTLKVDTSMLNAVCKQQKLVGFCRAAFQAWYFNPETGQCEEFIYGGCGGNDNRFNTKDECISRCGGATVIGKVPDPVKNILPVLKGIGPVMLDSEPTSTTETTTTTTTTEATTTTSYFDTSLDPGNEHDLYLKGRMNELKEHHMKVTQAAQQWDTAKQQLQRSGASEAKKTALDTAYDSTLKALTKEHARKQEQLLSAHQAKVDAIHVGARVSKMNQLKDALNSSSPKPSSIVRLYKHYLKTEQREQKHTKQHYDLAVQHGSDGEAKPQLQTRLDNIQSRVNNALELLHQHPETEMQILDQINKLVADMVPPITLDDGDDNDVKDYVSIDLQTSLVVDEPVKIDDGGLPAENTDNMEPIDDVIDNGYDVDDDDFNNEQDEENVADDDDDDDVSDEEPEPLQPIDSDMDIDENIDETDLDDDDDEDGDDDVTPGIAGVFDGYDGEKAYSELLWLRWLGIVAVGVGIVAVILMSVRSYQVRKNRRHKFVKIQVDDHLTAEERQLLQMQQNGYENPTYKFFEKQQLA